MISVVGPFSALKWRFSRSAAFAFLGLFLRRKQFLLSFLRWKHCEDYYQTRTNTTLTYLKITFCFFVFNFNSFEFNQQSITLIDTSVSLAWRLSTKCKWKRKAEHDVKRVRESNRERVREIESVCVWERQKEWERGESEGRV